MYQALYRKYRPTNFDSVIGQNVIVKTLKNSIVNHNFSHAYIFFGPRGTGKTTISKIFARSINCLSPINGNSCGKCSNCLISKSKDCLDIIEIDAASNNGVDEIRELRNNIALVPNDLKYKVYIVDEVHMLSIGAFNALLKTLEEPPEHAIFILATTDPQKVPDTIVSRCQCFSFKRISSDDIFDRLSFVCSEEKIKIDNDVLESIAIQSEGGLRDALSLLDQLHSYNNEYITISDFEEINGIISKNELDSFLNKIMSDDINAVLKIIDSLNRNGKNLIQIVVQLLNYSRNLLVDNYLNKKSISYSINKLHRFTVLLNERISDIKRNSNSKIFIELLIIDFIINNKNDKNVVEDTDCVEVKKENTNKSQVKSPVDKNTFNNLKINNKLDTNNNDNKIVNINEINKVRVNNALAKADKKLLKLEQSLFNMLSDYTFDQNFGYLVCNLMDSQLRVVSSDYIIISFSLESNAEYNLNLLNKLTDTYNKITNSNKKIAIVSDSEWDNIKTDYINNLKNNVKYELKEEPEEILEDLNKNDIITNSAVDLFGDIVEFE